MKRSLLILHLIMLLGIHSSQAQESQMPTTPDFTNAVEALSNGDIITCDSLLKEELGKYPKNGYAWLYRGMLYTRLKRDTAFTFLNHAVRNIPKKDKTILGAAYYWRGIAQWEFNEDFNGMMADMNTAKSTDTDTADPYIFVGNLLIQRGDYEGAEREFRQALTKSDVKKVDIYQYLGRNKAAQGDYAGAIRYYDQAMEFDRNDETIYIDRSQAYMNIQNEQQAIEDATKAFGLEYSRNSFNYLISLADSTELRDRVITRLNEETHRVSDPTPYHYAISTIYSNADNTPESLRYLLRASKSNEQPLYRQIAKMLASNALYDQAADYYYRAYREAQADSANQSTIDDLYGSYIGYTFEKGDVKKAIDLAQEWLASQEEPDESIMSLLMAFQYYNGDYADAMATLERYREIFTSTYGDILFAGKIYRENGLQDRARSEFSDCSTENAINEEPSTAEFALALLGEKERSRELFEQRLAEDADVNYFETACLMALLDDKPMAVSYLRQLFENGFRNFYKVERDEDLRLLKGYADFEALVAEYKALFEKERKALMDVLDEETQEAPIQLVGE